MIIEEKIWHEDHFAYHITKKKYIENIKKEGLQPTCGKRSIEANDTRKAIYFSDTLYLVEQWIEKLYKENNKQELELLKFNIKEKSWYAKDETIGDFYILKPILPENIEILNKYDELNNQFTIDKIQKQKKLNWDKLKKS